MILAIYLLAVVLLVAGFAGLISAINLVPTDLGFTYFQSGSMAICAGLIVLAIGLAAKVLDRGLKRLATPEAIRVPPAESVIDLPPLAVAPSAAPAAEAGLGTGIAIAGAAAAAGAVVATSLAGDAAPPDETPTAATPPEPPAMAMEMAEEHLPEPLLTAPEPTGPAPAAAEDLRLRTVEELERDLFAQMDALPEPPPVTIPELPDIPEVAEIPQPEIPAVPERPVVHAPAASGPDPFALPPLEPIPSPAFAGPERTPEPVIDRPPPAAPADATPDRDEQDAGAAAAPAEAIAPHPAPAPGLIHDADYAAVADEMLPPLAPVSTLDVIGAYDSGGTRFTMYSDGSVVAAGPDSERRFRSLDELRQHIDSGQM